MSHDPPEHLKDKYRLYAIWLNTDYGSRPISDMIIVHVSRPVSFATFCDSYTLNHIELTVQKTGQKILVSNVCGIQKIDNNNKPHYELTMDGTLKEII